MEPHTYAPLLDKLANAQFLPKVSRPRKEYWARAWLLEIASSIVSNLCIVALAVVLFVYDNEPVPSFSYGITVREIFNPFSSWLKWSLD